MQSSGFAAQLMRRWYLALFGVLLTAAFVATTLVLVPVSYTASETVLFLPPENKADPNGLLGLTAVAALPGVVARAALNDQAVAYLATKGVTKGYSVEVDITTSAPFLLATATGDTPDEALSAVRQVADLIPGTLSTLQRGVPRNTYIRSRTIPSAQKATAVTRTRTRLIFVALALGIVLTYLLTVLGDRALTSRQDKRSRKRWAQQLPSAEVEPRAVPLTGPTAAADWSTPRLAPPAPSTRPVPVPINPPPATTPTPVNPTPVNPPSATTPAPIAGRPDAPVPITGPSTTSRAGHRRADDADPDGPPHRPAPSGNR